MKKLEIYLNRMVIMLMKEKN